MDTAKSYHHFTATAIHYFGVSGGQELFRQQTLIVTALLTVLR